MEMYSSTKLRAILLSFIKFLLLCLQILASDIYTIDSIETSCNNKIHTIQLNANHIERSWQPEGYVCPWLPSNVTKSGPRSLVVELKHSLVVKQLTIIGADGGYQAAGSQVSALVAAYLPLELQLEDPCNASWTRFSNYSGWRPVGSGQVSVAYLLVNASDEFSWTQILIAGRKSELLFESDERKQCALRSIIENGQKHICFNVTACDRSDKAAVTCRLSNSSGAKINNPITGHKIGQLYSFYFPFNSTLHGALITCSQGQKTLQKVLLKRYKPKVANLTASKNWMTGRLGNFTFLTEGSFPEPQHDCWIAPGNTSSVKLIFRKRWIKNRKLYLISIFQTNVSLDLKGKFVSCQLNERPARINVAKSIQNVRILNILQPCVTSVGLGSSPYWIEGHQELIQIRSCNCTTWNASHTCWLTNSSKAIRTEPLIKINETQFTSIHQVEVSRWMAQSDWSVRCRVNQSGIEYEDVKSTREQRPDILYLTAHSENSMLFARVLGSNMLVSNISCNVVFIRTNNSSGLQPMIQDSKNKYSFYCELKNLSSGSWEVIVTCQLNDKHEQLHQLLNVTVSILMNSESSNAYSGTDLQLVVIILSLINIALLIVGAATWKLAASMGEPAVQSGISQGEVQHHESISADGNSQQRMQFDENLIENDKQELQFVTVVEVTINSIENAGHSAEYQSTSACDELDNCFLEVSGHYESDGCTFVRYRNFEPTLMP